MINRFFVGAALFAIAAASSATVVYTGNVTVAGGATDLSGLGAAFASDRLSFGSDLWYDPVSKTFWGNTDRGPGGGVVAFAPRVHQFGFDISPAGAISNFTLLKTVVFTRADGVTKFDGLNPRILNADSSVLGNSFDPEGLVVLPNGNLIVADEYGPSVYEFDSTGKFIRAFEVPANIVPRQAPPPNPGTVNYVDGRNPDAPGIPIVTGRQDNRGYEGLTISPDGTTLYAVLQDPLVNEGSMNDGRRSRNVRIIRFDVASGDATGQFIYRLTNRDDINAVVPGDTFGATAQGRNIGLSGIMALENGKFLVLERDNRGFGVDDSTAARPVGLKSVFLVDLAGATDVTDISLANSNALPVGVTPVSKSLWLDIRAELIANNVAIAEKIEGIAFGPYIDGGLSFIAVTDNDFSVTQSGTGEQFNVCTPGIGGDVDDIVEVALNVACPTGTSLIPTYAYAFKVSGDSLLAVVPEPQTWAMLIAGFGLVGGTLRRRRATSLMA